ncbi:hypothetical protein E8E15_001664 [Penicillium rubens]|uniref:Uncharacterized protein n=1 Tax=Penicillium chrysogenum TaxID=5076 RepID=A0A167R6F1_PENCH|nr:hypothetical protein E8E15_001664 [Penicillium rubens]KZN85614.1 hypothetical protein EN45_098040 [Penicillium chrysogenum]
MLPRSPRGRPIESSSTARSLLMPVRDYAEPVDTDTELSAAARIERWAREMRVTLGDAELTDTDEIDIGDVSLSTQSYTQPITETPAEPLFSFTLPR